MPAYRSSAEAEIRDEVVKQIRFHRPNARIIHEINVCGQGSNRIDLIAVDEMEIIAFEIKSAKDKLDRLPEQMQAMRRCASHVVSAIHEKFLVPEECGSHAAQFEKDGKHWRLQLPSKVGLYSFDTWVYPARHRGPAGWHDNLATWRFPERKFEAPLPSGALEMLWRDELYTLCSVLQVSATRRTDMGSMLKALRWHCTGKELTKGICTALRNRDCIEADPPMYLVERVGERA